MPNLHQTNKKTLLFASAYVGNAQQLFAYATICNGVAALPHREQCAGHKQRRSEFRQLPPLSPALEAVTLNSQLGYKKFFFCSSKLFCTGSLRSTRQVHQDFAAGGGKNYEGRTQVSNGGRTPLSPSLHLSTVFFELSRNVASHQRFRKTLRKSWRSLCRQDF